MKCSECSKLIGTENAPAYQVRAGHADEEDDFVPDEDVGYYCTDCLAKGV